MDNLRGNLTGPQVTRETHLPRRAKHAAHRAPGLRAQAGREASRVGHENGFDGLAVVEAQEEFACQTVCARNIVGHRRKPQGKTRVGSDVTLNPSCERRQEIGVGQVIVQAPVQRAPERPGVRDVQAVGGEGLRQHVVRQVVEGGHDGEGKLSADYAD